MSVAGATLEGGDQLVAGLDRAAGELEQLAPPPVADLVAGAVRALAPVKSGELERSVQASVSAGVVTVQATARHALPTEGGVPSRHIKAQPFMNPGLGDVEPQVVDLYTAEAQRVLDTTF